MNTTELMDRVARAQPQPPGTSPSRGGDLLEEIMAGSRTQQTAVRSPRRRQPLRSVAIVAITAVGAVGVVVAWPDAPSATAQVASAARNTAQLESGKATMHVTSTLDGRPNNGIVELMWNEENESYVFDYPQSSGHFETRILGRRVFQRNAAQNWREVSTSGQPENGGLARVSAGLADLAQSLRFEEVDQQADLRHFRAVGDLASLDDRAQGGFVFGTNGAPGATTTSLEVWVGSDGRIRKVRSSFTGTPDGHRIEADVVTELRDVGVPVEVVSPLP
jgi:hypothetical protein